MKPTSELSDIELREAVAVEVMGWQRHELIDATVEFPRCRWCGSTFYHGDPRDGWCFQGEPPAYESSIEAAFEVVWKMREDEFREFDLGTHGRHWGATFKGVIGEVWRKFAGYGESPARAICIAALTAVRARKS